MKKNAPLAFRIPGDLKKDLQRVADKEARSMSQICELFLRLGVEAYEKDGSRYLQRLLGNFIKD
jgi:predicted transcriptional regulator